MSIPGMNDAAFGNLLLLPAEQDLLLTALNSNHATERNSGNKAQASAPTSSAAPTARSMIPGSADLQDFDGGIRASGQFASPMQSRTGTGLLSNLGLTESPYLEYDVDDAHYDWDLQADQLIGDLPGAPVSDEDGEHTEKRKDHGEDDADAGGRKRHEGEDKTSKKPGRKLLTSEPTSKRKAQNRAAQRAFRERKEKHLKELETKVEDLEKVSDATNHENGLLRAKVDRLQTELKEYRSRFSLDSIGAIRPSAQTVGQPHSSKANWDINDNFQFEFPTFGPNLLPYGATAPSALVRRSTDGKATSPRDPAFVPSFERADSQMTSSRTSSYSAARSSRNPNELGTRFSPIVGSASRHGSSDYLSFPGAGKQVSSPTTSMSHVFSSGVAASECATASPSASSVSQQGLDSSCNTTPEPSAESPMATTSSHVLGDAASSKQSHLSGGETTVPAMMGSESLTPSVLAPPTPTELPNIDWFASQNGGMFDPVLFGDYRDPQESVMSAGGMNDFFDAAFPGSDLSSPTTNEPVLPPTTETPPQKESSDNVTIEDGDHKKFITCNMLWDRVQRSTKVKEEGLDMDDLCKQLKSKAKCSGTGVIIDQRDVDAILGADFDESSRDVLSMFK